MSTTEFEVPVRSADAAALMRPVPTRLFAFAVGVIVLSVVLLVGLGRRRKLLAQSVKFKDNRGKGETTANCAAEEVGWGLGGVARAAPP